MVIFGGQHHPTLPNTYNDVWLLTDPLRAAFTVTSPVLVSTNPASGPPGQNSLSVAITGRFTNFVQGTTTADFGTGITVTSLIVSSPTTATAVLNIDPAAPTGPHTVALTTGSEVASLANGFTVQGSATLLSISPTFGQAGTGGPVTIIGQNTHFAQGTTQLTMGAGITVTSVTVNSATSLTAQIVVASSATAGARTPTVTTGSEVVSLANGFNVVVNQAPVITIGPTWAVTLPSRLTITYTVTDDGLPLGGALTVTWSTVSGPGSVGFQNQTPTSISVGFDQPGTYILQISATDTQLTTTQNVTVTVTGSLPTPPTVSISSPIEGATITTLTNVTGSVASSALASWTLEFRMQNESTFRPIATGTTAVANATLGTFDPTLLLNGNALIQLRASDTVGQSSIAGPITVVVTGNQKIGNFTVSFNDLTVPVAGLPIQVVRTYDSRNKLAGDFGVGWTLDLKTVQLSTNGALGDNWNETSSGGAFPKYCIQKSAMPAAGAHPG
jgi:hypothetical protein